MSEARLKAVPTGLQRLPGANAIAKEFVVRNDPSRRAFIDNFSLVAGQLLAPFRERVMSRVHEASDDGGHAPIRCRKATIFPK